MDLLALIMIEGYHKSEQDDKLNSIYNPFVSGAWNYNKLKSTILTNLKNTKCCELEYWFDSPSESWKV